MLKSYGYFKGDVFQIPDPHQKKRVWALKKLKEGHKILEGNFDVETGKWNWNPMKKKEKTGGRKKKSTYKFCVKIWDIWLNEKISMRKLSKKYNIKYADILRVCSKRNYTYADYYERYKKEVGK